MKIIIAVVLMLISIVTTAQVRKEVFDYQFRPTPVAGYYYVVTEKKDSLWERQAWFLSQKTLYMEGSYKDDSCKIGHGVFSWYHTNGRLRSTVQYTDGHREGLFLSFHEQGMLMDSITYSKGRRKGVGLSFHENGYLADSTHFDGNGNGAEIRYYDDGKLSEAGYWMKDTLKRGRWKYYHRNGAIKAMEEYDKQGKKVLINCYDENGVQLDSLLCQEKPAFVEPQAWKRFLESSLRALVDQKAREGIKGSFTVVLRFVVNVDGSIGEIVPLTKYGYGIEDAVVKVFRKAPKWTPGRQYGKAVKSYHTQPISFVISE
jgi:antitoxin component YwqK of YwqJK toxin-antitoxin module